jgi:hypothetical protein
MSAESTTAARREAGVTLPRGWRDFVLQLLLFSVVDVVYELSRGLADGQAQLAFAHARDVVHIERVLGIFNELSLQDFALRHSTLLHVANLTYFHAHFLVSTAFLFWMYLRRNRHYYFVRNIVFAADALALTGYMLFPTAPPRMLSHMGFVDTLALFGSVNHQSAAVAALANPYAAVPSVHTCYALIIGITSFSLVRSRFLRATWLLYPALIVFSIVATANHFWFDAITGAGVGVLALSVAWAIERHRPTLPAATRRRLRLPAVAGAEA